MNLFNLTENYLTVQQLIDESEDSQAYIDTLESIEDAIEDKADSIAYLIKLNKGDIETVNEEIKRLQNIKKSKENAIENMKGYLFHNMLKTGKRKFKTATHTFYTGRSKSLDVVDESKIPKEYLIEQAPKVNKKDLKKYMTDNNIDEFSGAVIKESESVRIR